jgi:YidC/Oxa1 family membrane protein insertase
MFDLLATVLAWFYGLVPNYAAAIAMLTLCVMVLVTPLTLRATKSMLQMQRLQPELKRIQQQHKGDRQAMNEELMKFYQANKINPLGGCLPLLLQSPVFFVLYRVLHKLTETCNPEQVQKALAGDGNTRCLLENGTAVLPGTFGPSYLDKGTRLFQDLAGQTKMLSFGLDLSHSAVRELGDDVVRGLPYLVLVLIVTATSYIQQWQISVRTAKQGQPVNPQQAMLLKILPAFFAVISLTLPAGLVVYFLVSNTYRIAQQEYITRRFYREPLVPAGGDDLDDDDAKGGKPKPMSSKPGDKARDKATASKPEPAKKPMPAKRPQPKADGRSTTPPKGRPTGSSDTSPGKASGKGSSRPLPSKPSRPSPRRGRPES